MRILFLNICLVLLLASCSEPMPKPYAYFRIDLPQHEYTTFDSVYPPCTFEISKYAQVQPGREKATNDECIDIVYPSFKGRIYCTYKKIDNNLYKLSEDSRSLVYKHTVRADAIEEKPYENPDAKVYGILYEITGNAASPVQFVLTDSTRHFLRGSLYFVAMPNSDSIAPVSKFVEEDLRHLIETIRWK